ncbi:MAG TPA: ATP-binding protein [Candidatus Nanoarchaeia archaeon]|nr:ATP-binding protein [Candidatus Nanoarchaeia archaeon]
MLLGKITGKSSTNTFTFLTNQEANANKFQYIKIKHREGYNVLAQIVELETQRDGTRATCNVLGYRNDQGVLKTLRIPLGLDSEVYYADDTFVSTVLGLELLKEQGAYFGVLEGREKIKVYLDLNKLITKHVAILAKTGSGKSYSLSVLLEEILERGIPLIIIDPHAEYSSLKYPNHKKENFERFGIKPKGYSKHIQEYSVDVQKNQEAQQLTLNAQNLTGSELMHLLPAKLSSAQIGLLYSAIIDMGKITDFEQLIVNLQLEENPAKWTLITILDYLRKLNIFSQNPTTPQELIQPGKCTIINLRGVPQELQEIIVYKLLLDLFTSRKNLEIPPFFLVIEECHNYAPERSFGEVKSSSIIRQIAAEGRKFGVGLAVVSQRVARLDKSIISQANTQIILKLTNPGDLKAVSSSVEGITAETENEIKNLSVGTALVLGVVDTPLFVEVRPRKTKHGGEAVNLLETFNTQTEEPTTGVPEPSKGIFNILTPRVSKEELQHTKHGIKSLKTLLLPCLLLNCKQQGTHFNLLVNLTNVHLVKDFDHYTGEQLYSLEKLSEKERKILDFTKTSTTTFTAAELFSKSGMQFSEIYDIFNTLLKKKYFEKTGNRYALSNIIQSYLNLNKFSCHEKNEFIRITHDEIKEPHVTKEEVKALLGDFAEILGAKECYAVTYKAVYP